MIDIRYLLLILLVAVAGCSHVSSIVDSGITDTDADTDTDTDTDSDTDTESDTETLEDLKGPQHQPPVTNLYQEGVDGFVMVNAHTHAYGTNYTAIAQFFVVSFEEPPDDSEGMIAETGIDSCSLSYFGGIGSGVDSACSWLEAGTVEIESGPQYAELGTYDGGEVIPYTINLGMLAYDPRYGEEYSFFVSGDEAPAMDIAPAAVLPDQLDPITPVSGSVLSHDGFTFTWAAGDEAEQVYIDLMVHETSPVWSEMYEVRCWVVDDGEFEVPGLIASLLPSDWYINAGISRTEIVYHDLGEEQTILAVAGVSATADYTME